MEGTPVRARRVKGRAHVMGEDTTTDRVSRTLGLSAHSAFDMPWSGNVMYFSLYPRLLRDPNFITG